MKTNDRKSYYAIIPANVRYDHRLTPGAKLLFGEITALANGVGYCWASNDYFSELYKVNQKTISRWIKSLVEYKYIYSKILQKTSNNIIFRKLTLTDKIVQDRTEMSHPPGQNCPDPLDKNVPYNNKYNNKFNISCGNSKNEVAHEKILDKNSDAYLLAKLLEHEIRQNSPQFPESEANRQRWARDIDLMIRRDKLKADDIASVIIWCQQNDFWRANILSGKKLREKYLQLLLKMTK